MTWEVLSALPPGSTSRTRLARDGGVRVALRTLVPGCEPFIVGSSSPAVLPLLDVIEIEGQRCAIYDFVPGATLAEVVEALRAKGRVVRLDLLARVMIDASRAVGAIHTAVSPRAHGGLSSSALLIGFDGETRVLDFGASRLAGRFAAPDAGLTADVFSLGAILHEAITGFEGDYRAALAGAEPPPLPSSVSSEVTPALDDVVMTALAADPAGRQGNASQLADELEAVLAETAMPVKGVATLVQALFGDRLTQLKELTARASQPIPRAELELSPPTGEASTISLKREGATTSPGTPPSEAVRGARAAVKTSPGTPPSGAVLEARAEAAAEAEASGPTAQLTRSEVSTRNYRAPKTSDTDTGHQPVRDDPRALGAEPPSAEGTAPRIPLPVALAEEGTSPSFRVRPPVPNTATDLPAVPPPMVPMPEPQNTTEQERLKARGQERIPTPPFGSAPAVTRVATDVRRAHVPVAPAETGETEPAGETTTSTPRPRRARQIIAALLILIAAGFGLAAWTGKLSRKPVVIPAEPVPEAAPEDSGAAVAALEPAQALDAAVVEDAGQAMEAEDAGAVAAPDAGTDAKLDAGEAKPVPPVKKVPKKKRKRGR